MQNFKITDTYKIFYKLIINDSKIKVEDITDSLTHTIASKRTLLEYGLLLIKDEHYINYLPGSYDVQGNFYNHPIKLSNNLVLFSLEEKDFYGKSILGISKEEQNERNNPKGIKIVLHTIIDYEITSFTIYSNNSNGIVNALRTIYYLGFFLQEGFKLNELNPDFAALYTVGMMEGYTKDSFKRIVDFAYSLKFFEWSEISSRVGKDNRIESGVIFYIEGRNNYFAYLLNKYTDFKLVSENKFGGKNEVDYGYIPRKGYSEIEIRALDTIKYRNEIITALIKNYNSVEEIIYHFYKR